MLIIYSKIAYCIAGINIVNVVIAAVRSRALEADCKSFNENISSHAEYSDLCDQIYIYKSPFNASFIIIILSILSVCINFYFKKLLL